MLLAAVGIYGVVAYTTRQRTREIGIRVALGAEKGGIYRLVLGQGIRLTLAGLVVGTALAVAFTRLLKAQLFGVSETDAITFTSVGLLWPLSPWSRATSQPAAPRELIRWSPCDTSN
jgi:ABC-type antimicrobial peptide transport system permease subunit